MKAIQTYYKGYKFRSRLEARYAVMFESMGLTWMYEPEGFILKSGKYYLPDFYIKEIDSYIEVKPFYQKKEHDALMLDFYKSTMKTLMIFDSHFLKYGAYYVPNLDHKWSQGNKSYCYNCECIEIDKNHIEWFNPCIVGKQCTVEYTDMQEMLRLVFPLYYDRDYYRLWDGASEDECTMFYEQTAYHINKAKQARFEHGEYA